MILTENPCTSQRCGWADFHGGPAEGRHFINSDLIDGFGFCDLENRCTYQYDKCGPFQYRFRGITWWTK